ncbi:MAG: FAD-dependent oxidoreductase, partial [Deltaproteobacteria bacterium]|nr:FAD-dependent oxidoreductase [Deltaproteobacteria bacterium]
MRLSDPIEIRRCRLASRTVMAPMVPNLAGTDGAATPIYRDFYLERARAGVGFILLGGVYVHPDGRGFNNQLGIYEDRLIPGLEQLTAGIQPHCPVGVQLSFKSISRMPETFSLEEISRYCQAFAQGAVRAKKAGFDAVELHACHDYWLNYFLSPHFNHRSDAYGGSLENRFRLLREVVLAVREAMGQELALGVRLSLDEFVDDGLKPFETTQVGVWLEALGVGCLSASGGIGLTQHRMSPPMEVERGSLLPLARALKQAVGIPVIGVGRLDRPEVMRSAVANGDADMAAVARSLIADPAYAVKTLQNRDSDIRPCVACNFCLLRLHQGQALRCAVNPRAGRESKSFTPLTRDIYTVVVGGGPAGLSYAAAAAGRGARVRLYERKAELGGMVTVGARPPFKDVLEDFIHHLSDAVYASGVDVRTGCEVDAETLRKESAHKVVIATGASPLILPVDGAAQ